VKKNRKYIFLFFTVIFTRLLFSQQNKIVDSLFRALKIASHDTTMFNALIGIGNYYQTRIPDSAMYYHNRAKTISEKINDKLRRGLALRQIGFDHFSLGNYQKSLDLLQESINIAKRFISTTDDGKILYAAKKLHSSSLSNTGAVYLNMGDYFKSLDCHLKSLAINEEIGLRKAQAHNFNNIGNVYFRLAEHGKALEVFFKALKINEELGLKSGEAMALAGIGNIYNELEDDAKALEYYFRSLKLYEALGNKTNQSVNLTTIGIIYNHKGNYGLALQYFFKAGKMCEESGNKSGLAMNLGNTGSVYSKQGDSAMKAGNENFALHNRYPQALEYYLKTTKINEEIGAKHGLVVNYCNIGSVYTALKKYNEAEKYIQKSYLLAKEIGSPDDLKTAHENFCKLFEVTNNPAKALMHYKLFIQYRDSIFNDETTRKSIQQEFKFNYEKKFTADSVAFAKARKIKEVEIAMHRAEIKAKHNQQYALLGGLALVLIFSGFIYKRFQVTRNQKNIIEEQKKIVDEKQKELLDSIYYARRIQRSLLKPENYLNRSLKRLQKT